MDPRHDVMIFVSAEFGVAAVTASLSEICRPRTLSPKEVNRESDSCFLLVKIHLVGEGGDFDLSES